MIARNATYMFSGKFFHGIGNGKSVPTLRLIGQLVLYRKGTSGLHNNSYMGYFQRTLSWGWIMGNISIRDVGVRNVCSRFLLCVASIAGWKAKFSPTRAESTSSMILSVSLYILTYSSLVQGLNEGCAILYSCLAPFSPCACLNWTMISDPNCRCIKTFMGCMPGRLWNTTSPLVRPSLDFRADVEIRFSDLVTDWAEAKRISRKGWRSSSACTMASYTCNWLWFWVERNKTVLLFPLTGRRTSVGLARRYEPKNANTTEVRTMPKVTETSIILLFVCRIQFLWNTGIELSTLKILLSHSTWLAFYTDRDRYCCRNSCHINFQSAPKLPTYN